MPQENQRRGELEHLEKGLGMTFISNDQAPEVLQPCKQLELEIERQPKRQYAGLRSPRFPSQQSGLPLRHIEIEEVEALIANGFQLKPDVSIPLELGCEDLIDHVDHFIRALERLSESR